MLFNHVSGMLVLFDITSKESLEAALTWKQYLDIFVRPIAEGVPVPCFLVANKTDLQERSVTPEGLNLI